MKAIVTTLLVLLLVSPVAYAQQSARAQLKIDPAIQALGLSDAALEALFKKLAEAYVQEDLGNRAAAVSRLAIKMLNSNAALRVQFIDERKAERKAEAEQRKEK